MQRWDTNMPMDSKAQRFIKEIIANMRCAVCGSYYQADNVRIIGQQADLLVARLTCSQCDTQGLVFATLKEGEPSFIGEIGPEEWERFRRMSKLSIDDVLDMHRLLRDFQGDLKELLEG